MGNRNSVDSLQRKSRPKQGALFIRLPHWSHTTTPTSDLHSYPNKNNLDMRQFISRPSSWSQSTHGDGEHHLTVSPFNYVMSVSLAVKAEDTLQEAIHVSMWFQTSSHNDTDQPLFFTQIVCSGTSCLLTLVPWHLYPSLPPQTHWLYYLFKLFISSGPGRKHLVPQLG